MFKPHIPIQRNIKNWYNWKFRKNESYFGYTVLFLGEYINKSINKEKGYVCIYIVMY